MAIIAFNTTVKKIVTEVEKFDLVEQQAILAYLKAKQLQGKPAKKLAPGFKAPSLTTIDSIKHKSRKNAGK
jgi:hypothetical protein